MKSEETASRFVPNVHLQDKQNMKALSRWGFKKPRKAPWTYNTHAIVFLLNLWLKGDCFLKEFISILYILPMRGKVDPHNLNQKKWIPVSPGCWEKKNWLIGGAKKKKKSETLKINRHSFTIPNSSQNTYLKKKWQKNPKINSIASEQWHYQIFFFWIP